MFNIELLKVFQYGRWVVRYSATMKALAAVTLVFVLFFDIGNGQFQDTACRGNYGLNCTQYQLMCPQDGDPGRISLGMLSYRGNRNTSCVGVANCEGDYFQACCTPFHSDCAQSFTREHAFEMYTNCSGKATCNGTNVLYMYMNECGGSNFFAVDYGCVPRSKTVDFCGSQSITGPEVHVSFSGEQPPNFSDSTNGCRKTCSCTATSASGNRLTFRAVDVRLQKPSTENDNIQCSGSRLKLSETGYSPQLESCLNNSNALHSFRYGRSGLMTSYSWNVAVDLMDIALDDYPASVWIEVHSLLQGDRVTVSCHNPTNTDPMCGVTTTPVPTTQFVPTTRPSTTTPTTTPTTTTPTRVPTTQFVPTTRPSTTTPTTTPTTPPTTVLSTASMSSTSAATTITPLPGKSEKRQGPDATLILAILLPILAVIIILAIIGACCFKRRQAMRKGDKDKTVILKPTAHQRQPVVNPLYDNHETPVRDITSNVKHSHYEKLKPSPGNMNGYTALSIPATAGSTKPASVTGQTNASANKPNSVKTDLPKQSANAAEKKVPNVVIVTDRPAQNTSVIANVIRQPDPQTKAPTANISTRPQNSVSTVPKTPSTPSQHIQVSSVSVAPSRQPNVTSVYANRPPSQSVTVIKPAQTSSITVGGTGTRPSQPTVINITDPSKRSMPNQSTIVSTGPPSNRAPTVTFQTGGASNVTAVQTKPVSQVVSSTVRPKPASQVVSSTVQTKPVSQVVSSTVQTKPVSHVVSSTVQPKPVSQVVSSTVQTKPVSQVVSSTVQPKPASQVVSSTVQTKPVSHAVSSTVQTKPVSQVVSSTVQPKPVPQVASSKDAPLSGGPYKSVIVTSRPKDVPKTEKSAEVVSVRL